MVKCSFGRELMELKTFHQAASTLCLKGTSDPSSLQKESSWLYTLLDATALF
jgi:hypothetical protein